MSAASSSSEPLAAAAAKSASSVVATGRYDCTTVLANHASGEDGDPFYVPTVGGVVADGHGGRGCVDVLGKNEETLKKCLEEDGPLAVIRLAKRLCLKEPSGAMCLAFRATGDSVVIASLGDCTCLVFQNGRLLRNQPHHGSDYFQAHAEELLARDVRPYWLRSAQPKPLADGSFTWEPSPLPGMWSGQRLSTTHKAFDDPYSSIYFVSQNDRTNFAQCAGLGHFVSDAEEEDKIYEGADPIVTTTAIDTTQPYTIVAGSDGFGDVWHPQDPYLLRGDYDAQDLLERTKARWLTPQKVVSTTYPNETFTFASSAAKSDDVSIVVFRYQPSQTPSRKRARGDEALPRKAKKRCDRD